MIQSFIKARNILLNQQSVRIWNGLFSRLRDFMTGQWPLGFCILQQRPLKIKMAYRVPAFYAASQRRRSV
jgi:hypothetical protein